MRKEKSLISLLDGLVKVLAEEAGRNPDFANRLDALLSPLPMTNRTRSPRKRMPQNLPDIYTEFNSRGQTEFSLWLCEQSVAVLHALIRVHDLDATRRTAKWKEPEKLSAFITDQIRSRLARGSAFLSKSEGGPK